MSSQCMYWTESGLVQSRSAYSLRLMVNVWMLCPREERRDKRREGAERREWRDEKPEERREESPEERGERIEDN